MYIELCRHGLIDVPEEGQKLLMPMTGFALRNDFTRRRIERCEQGCSAMPDVVMRHPFEVAQTHRQYRLRALQRLALALLVDAQYERIGRWAQVQPDNIAHLLDEVRISRELETF